MSLKKKKRDVRKKVKPVSKHVIVTAHPIEAPIVSSSTQMEYPPVGWTVVLGVSSVLLAILCQINHFTECAVVFITLGILIGVSFIWKPKDLNQLFLLLGLGWVLAALSLGTFPSHQYAYSFFLNFKLTDPILHFAIGFGLLLAFWRYLPPADPAKDISSGWAKVWFWIIMAVAVFMRMYKIHEAVGCYWDDPGVCIADPRSILEYHVRALFMPVGTREPFFSYYMAALWSLMPDAYGIFVQRLGDALMDLVGVWLFYLLGKEVGGRRTGLVAAALGAVSKPMLIQDLLGMTGVTIPFVVSLLLLMTFRLFRKPDWFRFLQWGLVLGFAPYNYTPARLWVLFLVVVVFLWIWFYKQKENKGTFDFLLGWGTLLTWTFLFFLVNNFLPTLSHWVSFLSQIWVGLTILAILLISFCVSFFTDTSLKNHSRLIPKMFLGVLLAFSIVYPLASSPQISLHPSGLSIFHNRDNLSVQYSWDLLKTLWDKVMAAIRFLFLNGQDRDDMNIPGGGFFDYHFIPIFMLGFASLVAQPNWKKIFLLLGAFVGISPHVLSIDPHSAKLLAAIVPLAVLAGLGAQQFYSTFGANTDHGFRRIFLFLFAIFYFTWAIWGSFDQVWNNYFVRNRMDKTVALEVERYYPSKRIYVLMGPGLMSYLSQSLMNQGRDVYQMNAENPIILREGETPKDLVIIMASSSPYRQEIFKQFKNVSWQSLGRRGAATNGDPEVAGVAIIPASEISEKPGKMFYIKRVPAQYWLRDYFTDHYILGAGLYAQEEGVSSPYDLIPPALGGNAIRIRGIITLASDGPVVFSAKTNNYVLLSLDGKRILRLEPDQKVLSASGTLNLSAGPHEVDYITYLQYDKNVPPVMMTVGKNKTFLMGGTSPVTAVEVIH